jgi:hypothetical protein
MASRIDVYHVETTRLLDPIAEEIAPSDAVLRQAASRSETVESR